MTSRRLVLIARPILGVYVDLVGIHDDLCQFPTFPVPFKTFGHRGAGTRSATTGISTPTVDALSHAIAACWLASRFVGRFTFAEVQQEKAAGEWSSHQSVLGSNSILLLIRTACYLCPPHIQRPSFSGESSIPSISSLS